MKVVLSALSVSAVIALGAGLPALAHHSMAMFDGSKEVKIEGTVKSFAYTNPHAWLYVDTVTDGKPVTWGFELGAPTLLQRQKIFPTTFKAGEKLTIDAAPMRDGRNGGNFIRARKADGVVIGRPVQAAQTP